VAATQQNLEQQHRLFAELWTSFVALIRSYVAAYDLARPVLDHSLVDEDDDRHLKLRGKHKILELEFDAAKGAGNWTIYEHAPGAERVLERGKFGIGEDSRVRMSDRSARLEMEVAAEAFTAKVLNEE
jgi:hypothetical protein